MPASGEVFRRELLSRDEARDPMEAYAAVLGRPPRIEPLLNPPGCCPWEPLKDRSPRRPGR